HENSEQRLSELLISLFTGSINDIEKVDGLNVPDNILDKVKKKILLFDSTQTNFLFNKKNKKRLVIQGLSGTGKTELLLHKLKDLYINSENSKILFTCHNKILANNLKKRIPSFFNFMKVEQQIEWNQRLWCIHAWGSQNDINSGAYRYICHFYNIPFLTYGNNSSFSEVCRIALDAINNDDSNNDKYAFDYIMIDESQDFSDNFINLCERVAKDKIYIAGDIFQSIFGTNAKVNKDVDYLLNQCYRTDPKTLMFSHGLGMGLFENSKLQWPTDEEWQAYGYTIKKHEERYHFSRLPIRRFEDIQTSDSVLIRNINCLNKDEIASKIVESITEIKRNNSTIKPSDIAVIFIEKNRAYNNDMSAIIERKLRESGIEWKINLAFETQVHKDGQLCITNHNNVKGLEFPFVICVSPNNINKDLRIRNALYMAMTRSFIQSTLFINIVDPSIWRQYESGLQDINEKGEMIVTEPDHSNKEEIKQLNLNFDNSTIMSFRDLVLIEIRKQSPNINMKNINWVFDGVLNSCGETYDTELIRSKVKSLLEVLS
ncbi:DEAD/DEAH box helicase, partial [Neisseria canis]